MRMHNMLPGLLAFTAAACAEQTTAPSVSDAGIDSPVLSSAHAPVAAGVVVRSERQVAVGWTDERNGTFVMIGFDPAGLCTGSYAFDMAPIQQVYRRDGSAAFQHLQGTGVQTSVWPFPSFNCALFTTVAPLARGLSDLVYTDNDYSGAGPANTNAFGYRAHGTLTRGNGTSAAFSAHVSYRFNGNQGFQANSQISLH